MIICVCAVLNEDQIKDMAKTMTLNEIMNETGAGLDCSSCGAGLRRAYDQAVSELDQDK